MEKMSRDENFSIFKALVSEKIEVEDLGQVSLEFRQF